MYGKSNQNSIAGNNWNTRKNIILDMNVKYSTFQNSVKFDLLVNEI